MVAPAEAAAGCCGEAAGAMEPPGGAAAAGCGQAADCGLDRRRWLVLFGVTLVGFVQCIAWMTFSGNPDVVRLYYGLCPQPGPCQAATDAMDLLLNWGPIMYLLVAPFVAVACSRGVENVWWVVLAAALLSAAGTLLRLVPSLLPSAVPPTSALALWCLHIGQALNAAAGPANCSTPSVLAATWFAPEERTTATATVFALQTAGPAVGLLLALPVHAGGSRALVALLLGEAALGVLALLVWLLLPRRPCRPPSVSQELRSLGSCSSSSSRPGARRWLSASMLFLAGGVVAGVFQLWAASMPVQLEGLLPAGLLKWLAFDVNLASLAGTLAVGPAVARFGLGARLRGAIAALLAAQLLGYGGFAVLMQAPATRAGMTSLLVVLLIAASLAQGAVGPLIYELSAELTYPYSESVSGTVYAMSLNGFGLVLGLVEPHLPSSVDTYAMVGSCLAALICLSFVREDYARRAVDSGPLACGTDDQPLCSQAALA